MSEPTTPQPAGNPATEPAQPPPAPSAAITPAFTQEQFNAALAEEKRKWKKQQDETAAELKRKADDEAAAARGEFEKIAGERGARVTALETELEGLRTSTQERLTALETEMGRQIKARLKELPEEIKAMAPEGDTLTRFAWLDKAEAAAAKLTAAPSAPKPPLGTPPGPRGSGTATNTHTPDLAAQKRQSGEYVV